MASKSEQRPFAGRVYCPFPGCDHTGDMITKVHSRTHGMEREDLFSTYGQPQRTAIDPIARRENYRIKTILPNNSPTISSQSRGTSRT